MAQQLKSFFAFWVETHKYVNWACNTNLLSFPLKSPIVSLEGQIHL